MMTFSKIRVVGQRECEQCGSNVNIIETVKDNETVRVSECLNCENEKVQKEAIAFKKRMDQRRSEMIFEKYSLIPSDLLKASFENYDPKNQTQAIAKRECQKYVKQFGDNENKGFLLQGSYGIGKSHLSYSIAKSLKDKGYTVIFITMPELLNVLRDSYGNSGHSEIDILEACKNADLLILDDLGAEYVKTDSGNESWAADKLFQIINSRLDKAVIYTTNLSSTELKEKYGTYGGRIVSRMMNGTKVLKMMGKDQRVKGW